MFIELTRYSDGEKVMVNTNLIELVWKATKKTTGIKMVSMTTKTGDFLTVKESYETVIDMLKK